MAHAAHQHLCEKNGTLGDSWTPKSGVERHTFCHLGLATARTLSLDELSECMGWVCAAAKGISSIGQCIAIVSNCTLSQVLQVLRSFSGAFLQKLTALVLRHVALTDHGALRSHAGSITVVPRAARLDDMQGRKLTSIMVESVAAPRLLPSGLQNSKRLQCLAHKASPLIPMTTSSTTRRQGNRDQLAQTSGSCVARASSTVATVARVGTPLQMLACATVALATQENIHQRIGAPSWLGYKFPFFGPRRNATTSWHVTCCGFFNKGAPRDEAVKVLCAVRWSRPMIPTPMSKGLPLAGGSGRLASPRVRYFQTAIAVRPCHRDRGKADRKRRNPGGCCRLLDMTPSEQRLSRFNLIRYFRSSWAQGLLIRAISILPSACENYIDNWAPELHSFL